MLELEDSLNAIASSQTVEALRELMSRRFSDLGYSGFTYMDVRRVPLSGEPVPFFASTIPPEYNETYIAENFFNFDPVIRRAATTNVPFTWSDCPEYHTWRQSRRGAKNKSRYVMQFADDHGYTEGYVLPSHAVDAHGRPASGLTTLFWRDRPENFDPRAATPSWLRLAVASMHERFLELRAISTNDIVPPNLTDRERECLIWACRGKTRGETADILSISDRTVEFHFQNAMKKLRVHNKFHAIAMAVHLGVIMP